MIVTESRQVTITNCRAKCDTCGETCLAGMNAQHAEDLAVIAGWTKNDDGTHTCNKCKGNK